MNFIEPNTGLKISVSKKLLDKLYAIGMHHYPKEFGGILMGKYSNDNTKAILMDTILPVSYTSSKFHFDRGTDGLKEMIFHFYERTPRLIYLGEWHTHPDGPTSTSTTDKKAMEQIAADPKVVLNNPLLLILSINRNGYQAGFYVQVGHSLHTFTYENN